MFGNRYAGKLITNGKGRLSILSSTAYNVMMCIVTIFMVTLFILKSRPDLINSSSPASQLKTIDHDLQGYHFYGNLVTTNGQLFCQ